VYAANCAGCHGATAAGGRNGPDIRCTDEFGEMRGGAEGMPAFPSFGAPDVARLASYVHGFCSLGGGGGD